MAKTDKWIIGIGGSHADDVFTYIVEGTDSQVKHHLLSRVKDGKDSCEVEYGHKVDFYTKKVSDITIMCDGNKILKMYACCVHPECHIDYTANRIAEDIIHKL